MYLLDAISHETTVDCEANLFFSMQISL